MATSKVVLAGPPPSVMMMAKLVKQRVNTRAVMPGSTRRMAGQSRASQSQRPRRPS